MNESYLSKRENKEVPHTYEIDVTGYIDAQDRNETFVSKLEQLPFYNRDHLYCGFTDNQPKTTGDTFAADQEAFTSDDNENFVNPLDYAFNSTTETEANIAVYDQTKMHGYGLPNQYKIISPDALIAVIRVVDNS